MSLLILLLASLPSFAQSCIVVEPGKSIGPMRIGEAPPKEIAGKPLVQEKDIPEWWEAGPYRLRLNESGKIDLLQFSPDQERICYRIAGRNFESFEKLVKAKKKKQCIHSGIVKGASAALYCDGFHTLLSFKRQGKGGYVFWRIDVGDYDVKKERSRRAGSRATYELRNHWPFKNRGLFK